jgi:hypothetical protein
MTDLSGRRRRGVLEIQDGYLGGAEQPELRPAHADPT